MRLLHRRGASDKRHAERYREIVGILVEEGFDWIGDETGLAKLAPRRRAARSANGRTPEAHARHTLERLGVTFIKGGQALSTRADMIPPALAAELSKLQDEVPPQAFETMRDVIELELGMPLDEAFSSFDPEPIGTASIGQVYRATLPDGTRVAVKVQRPGVAEQGFLDLDIAMGLARNAQARLGERLEVDLVGIAGVFADSLRSEFDYLAEARNAEHLWRAFKDNETVSFPAVYWSHCSAHVLTLELMEGVSVNHLEALEEAGYDRAALAHNGIVAYLRMIFEVGVFHADPHPGNFIALPGNRVGFTDFGRVSTISVESRERLIDLFYAGLRRDEEAGADALLALASNPDVDEVALQRDVARLISQFTNRALGDIDIGDLLTGIITLFRTHRLGMPRDFALMLATMVMLEGMGTTLDPGFDFSKVVAPFVESAIAGRTNLGHLTERLERDMRRGVRMFERMPSQVDRILRRIARGDIRMEVAPRDYETLLERIAELVNRLAFAIVVAASIVGATTLLGIETVPKWMHTFGAIGLVGSVLVSVWFFGSIFSAHYQAKRKRR